MKNKIQGSSFANMILKCDVYYLLDKLGNPTIIGSGDNKVQLEWQFSYRKKIITIYDYKTNCPIYEIGEWHIGTNDVSFDELQTFLIDNSLWTCSQSQN
jgi:hypothetical protein